MFTFSETPAHPSAPPPDADAAPADVESAIQGTARDERLGAGA